MRISDWSSDVCSSDLCCPLPSWRSAFLGRCDAGDRPCRIGRLAECREPVAGHDDWLCCRGGGAGRLADGGSSLPHAAASTPCRYCLRQRLYRPLRSRIATTVPVASGASVIRGGNGEPQRCASATTSGEPGAPEIT